MFHFRKMLIIRIWVLTRRVLSDVQLQSLRNNPRAVSHPRSSGMRTKLHYHNKGETTRQAVLIVELNILSTTTSVSVLWRHAAVCRAGGHRPRAEDARWRTACQGWKSVGDRLQGDLGNSLML